MPESHTTDDPTCYRVIREDDGQVMALYHNEHTAERKATDWEATDNEPYAVQPIYTPLDDLEWTDFPDMTPEEDVERFKAGEEIYDTGE